MATTKVEPDRDPPLCRYEVGGRRFIHSVYWSEHQRPNRPGPSMHPPCPIHERLSESDSERATASLTEPPLSRRVLEFEGLTEGEFEGLKPAAQRLTPPPARGAKNQPRCEHCNNPLTSAYHRNICRADTARTA